MKIGNAMRIDNCKLVLRRVEGLKIDFRVRGGFTLVELLVVISIMGILLSILLPCLSRTRAMTKEVVCGGNLRTWGQTFLLYADDYDGTLPHTDDRARNRPPDVYDPAHPEHECCYIDLLPPLMGRLPWRDFANGRKPVDDIWQCPEAEPLPDSAYSPSYQPSVQGYHSYAMNSYLEHDFEFGIYKQYPSFLKLSLCRAPTRTILMFEQTLDPGQGYGQQGGHSMAGRYTAEDARALTERHAHIRGGLGGNVIMLDGHRQWRNDLWDESLGNPRIPLENDLTWFPY
jgi:prepilin-type N-terminal cleavage/methylation domain-containing protein